MAAVPESDVSLSIPDHEGNNRNGLISDGNIDHFYLFNDSTGPNCSSTHIKDPLVATKLTKEALTPLQSVDIHPSEKAIFSQSGLWTPPLKAVPLASYYKLHRVPSLAIMSEPTALDSTQDATLPRRESTTQPLEQISRNDIPNRILDQVVRTPGRQPSPQPTHLSVPGPGPHRVLHEEGFGYIAPKFEGKDLQMEQGMVSQPPQRRQSKGTY